MYMSFADGMMKMWNYVTVFLLHCMVRKIGVGTVRNYTQYFCYLPSTVKKKKKSVSYRTVSLGSPPNPVSPLGPPPVCSIGHMLNGLYSGK